MGKTYICDYFAKNKDGKSVGEYSEILNASNLKELSESILNMCHRYMENYNAVNIMLHVYKWSDGVASKYFDGRVSSNYPTNILI